MSFLPGIFLFEDDLDDNQKPLHYLSRPKKSKCYDKNKTKKIQIFYIVAAVIWILIVYFGNFSRSYDLVSIVILSIPVIAYLINYSNCGKFSEDLGSEILKGNLLSFVFLIFIIFINWDKVIDKNKFFRILIVALILVMFSLIDLWMSPDNMEIFKHTKTSLQTAALALLAFAIYKYYLAQTT